MRAATPLLVSITPRKHQGTSFQESRKQLPSVPYQEQQGCYSDDARSIVLSGAAANTITAMSLSSKTQRSETLSSKGSLLKSDSGTLPDSPAPKPYKKTQAHVNKGTYIVVKHAPSALVTTASTETLITCRQSSRPAESGPWRKTTTFSLQKAVSVYLGSPCSTQYGSGRFRLLPFFDGLIDSWSHYARLCSFVTTYRIEIFLCFMTVVQAVIIFLCYESHHRLLTVHGNLKRVVEAFAFSGNGTVTPSTPSTSTSVSSTVASSTPRNISLTILKLALKIPWAALSLIGSFLWNFFISTLLYVVHTLVVLGFSGIVVFLVFQYLSEKIPTGKRVYEMLHRVSRKIVPPSLSMRAS